MRKILLVVPGLVILLIFAFILRHAQDEHQLTPASNRAEEQRLRSEIQKASARLKQIEKPKQFLPR